MTDVQENETASDELIAELLAGLEGVTPGPWEIEYGESGNGPDTHAYALLRCVDDESYTGVETSEVNSIEGSRIMEHIARCSPENIRKLIARIALPTADGAQQPAAVKPLEWDEPTRATNGCWTAKSALGTYSVVNEGGWYAVRDETPRDFYFEWCGQDMSRDTLASAKAAAQADYEQRIRSALYASPPAQPAADGAGEI